MPVDNYVIFYIPDKTKKLVTVIRVMYSGRDVDKQLDEFTKLCKTVDRCHKIMELQ